MKLITRETDYAIRALSTIAQDSKEIVTVTDLVDKTKIPRPFLRKLLQRLNKEGLLKSYKGKNGGFSLVVTADKILVSDVITIFQGSMQLNECLFKKDMCPHTETCSLRKIVDNIQDYATTTFEGVTLQDLLTEERNEN
ncbi:RrF2 family transcriptional regulator [Candidatus Omnitrophota bacterium]